MKNLIALTVAAAMSASMAFAAAPATSDDFDSATLGSHWNWKNAPAESDGMSLTAAPGKLRLKTTAVSKDFGSAQGTLVQPVGDKACTAVVKITTAKMKEGDAAGFGIVTGQSNALLSVKVRGIRKFVVLEENDADKLVIPMPGHTVYLRTEIGDDHLATLSFSSDGEQWTPVGDSAFAADPSSEFAIYNFSTKKTGGSVDVDFFHVD